MTKRELLPKFTQSSIGEFYHVWDTDSEKWVEGILTELGEDTIVFKWADMTEETEYELSDLPLIVSYLNPKQLEEISPLRMVWKYLINKILDLQIESILETENIHQATEYMVTKLMQEFKLEKK